MQLPYLPFFFYSTETLSFERAYQNFCAFVLLQKIVIISVLLENKHITLWFNSCNRFPDLNFHPFS